MQIDFHHAVTYVVARIAGFSHADADIVAYAAQYVDDATCSGPVRFDNGAIYLRSSSAYRSIDLANLDPLNDLQVWMPFHFLPGNGNADPGENPAGTFIHKLVTRPDSPIAQEMVRAAICDHDKPYALHRLGITMHVYADTWAHQGFAGVQHKINDVDNFKELGPVKVFKKGLGAFINQILEDVVPPLGHGRANVFPDLPFLVWSYKDGHGTPVSRNNTDEFCSAADAMCRALQEYRRHTNATVQVTGLPAGDLAAIRSLFATLRDPEEKKRHAAWLQAIASGKFSCGPATIAYSDDGPGSWKALALGDGDDRDKAHVYPYRDTFLASNWKFFHDALQLHRLTVTRDILPRYGICAA